MPEEGPKSQLLPLLAAGSIKYPEEYSKIHINCDPDAAEGGTASAGNSGLENIKLGVLFPEGTDDAVPLIGGSVVKISLSSGTKMNTDKPELLGRYDTSKLARYVREYIPEVGKKNGADSEETDSEETDSEETDENPFVKLAYLTDARIQINKTLEAMPGLATEWHEHGVPTLALSSSKSSEFEDVKSLQKKIDEKQKNGIRIKELGRPIGYFKFIPPQVLASMFQALMSEDTESYGMMGEYYGISGESFYSLSLYLQGQTDGKFAKFGDEEAVKILLDMFPIIRVSSNNITGPESTLSNIGYYTAHEDSLYIKMPDLSGRDSNGDGQNIYGLGPDESSSIKLCFELVKDVEEYAGKAFEHIAPPAPEVKEGSVEFPENAGAESSRKSEITIYKEGLDDDNINDYSFYLSPILPAGSSTSSRGLETTGSAVEIFTAPVLTASYLKEYTTPVVTFSKEQISELLREFSKKVQTGGVTGYNAIFKDTSGIGIDEKSDGNTLTHLEFSKDHKYKFEELGLPMSESLSAYGVDSVSQLLGELNRPEILIGFRDGKGPEKDNESKFYDPKIYGAKKILASNRPNIILKEETQLPANWIPLNRVDGEEDDSYILEVPYKQTADEGPRSSLEIYNDMGVSTFALYAVDHVGQMVRFPGENIKISPNSPCVSLIKPNGYAGDAPVNLGTALSPSLSNLFADNTLTGIRVKGQGFVGTNPIINFYSDSAGKDLIASVRDGMKIGADQHEVRIKDIGSDTISIETKGTIGDLLPALVGTYYIAVQLETGVTSATVPFYVAKASTKKEDLPVAEGVNIKFKDAFGLKVKGFPDGLHSIPIIQDSVNNASITIKADKKTFVKGVDVNLYAYIAVLKNEHNKSILESDIGWPHSSTHKDKSILTKSIKTEVSEAGGNEFYIPTEIEWEYGSVDFKRDNARKVTLKFPGTANMNMNMSRFTELTAGDNTKEHPAYILLVNSKLSTGTNIPEFLSGGSDENSHYAVIPIGVPGGRPDSEVRAFTSVPEILGFVAELPSEGGEPRIVSNIPQKSLKSGGIEGHIKGMSVDAIAGGTDQILSIISSDALDRLAIIFKGGEVPRMEKMHNASIGTKSLKDNCVSVEYAEDNKIVANYKNISGIKSEGWTDIVVTKTDRRFKCSYDSTLWSKVTIDVPPAEDPPDGEEGIVDKDGHLLSKQDLLISQFGLEESPKFEDLSTVIFPGGNGTFSPLPLIKDLSYKYPSDKAPDIKTYYQFSNPLKIKPSQDLVFGASISEPGSDAVKVFGMSLTDSPVLDGKPGDEVIKINKNGQTAVAMSLLDMADAIKKAKEEAQAVIQNIKDNIAKVKDKAASIADQAKAAEMEEKLAKAEANYNDVSTDATDAAEKAEQSFVDKSAADKAAMEAAMAGSQGGAGEDGGSGAVDALNDAAAGAAEAADAAMAAAGAAMEGINNALGMLQTISDALSSIADIANQIAEGVEGAISSLGARPDDFVKSNIKYIYIDKDTVLNSNAYKSNADKSAYKVTVNSKISQNAAIKFNVPEIVEIRLDGDDKPYLPFGDRPFASLVVKSGKTIRVKVIGANQDTKFEIGGKRVNARRDSPFSVGIFQNFIIKIPPMSDFSIFGTGDCLSLTATNSNENRMRLGRTVGNDLTLNLEDAWDGRIFGGGRNKSGPSGDIAKHLEDLAFLKFTFVKLGKVAGGMKESLQSFCDFSFHLTAELSLQLRNFQVLLIPIKVIFCIIDVICALLNPWRLAFAIIRLFLCLYDLILLLPQIAVPAMYLALLLHLLDLLLCVILKILSTVNAINEVITALARAIEHKNYPAVVALEEALNEHIFSLETDLSVLEPIITILNLFLQLLQLAFAFPCRVGSDDDDDACIDPSQLAGIILGKVAPTGAIAPNVLLPLAQAYTRLPPGDTYGTGNSPPGGRDNSSDMNGGGPFWPYINGELGNEKFDIVVRPEDENGSIVAKSGTPGLDIPNFMNNATGEMKQIQEGGYFRGDSDGDGSMDNISYPYLRTNYVEDDSLDFIADGLYYGANDGYFDATFALSFTKSTKEWSFFTGPDPRIVRYQFNSGGVSSDIAWWTWWLIFPIFFSKKTVSAIQTIDSPPMFLAKDNEGHLTVSARARDFTSPIDGATGFLKSVGKGYQPKPLTVTFDLNEPQINPDTLSPEFVPVTVTKTFGNIPMIAIVDDEFNVYFVEQDGPDGGIIMKGSSIESINLKMINYPSAPKKKTGRQKETAFSNRKWRSYDSIMAERIAFLGFESGDGAGTGYDWQTCGHDGSGTTNPITGSRYTNANFYTTDGPEHPDTGEKEWKKDDSKYDVYRSGEAILRATANAAWLKGKTIESPELYYNGERVDTYLTPNNSAGSTNIEYILHTKSGKRYENALRCYWSPQPENLEPDADPEYASYPEKYRYTLKGKTANVTLSTQQGESSPYSPVFASDGTDVDTGGDGAEYGDPYWPVGFAGPAATGHIEIHIVEALYHPTDNPGFPNRWEVLWDKATFDDAIPYPKLCAAYDFGGGSNWEQGDIGDSITAVKTYDFPQFYIVDMRQLADDIAAACGASGPAELLMDLPGFEEPFEDNIQEMMECMEAFLNHFNSEDLDDQDIPKGMIPYLKYQLAKGELPGQISIEDAVDKYEVLKQCVKEQIDKTCRFVVNPLNTSFKLLGDEDETPLSSYINPEQEDLGDLLEYDIVDELEFDTDLAGFPQITGAMEYASGIGDTIIAEVETKAIIEFLPRDCYDEPMPLALDLTDKIEIEFVSDESNTAKQVPPEEGSDAFVSRDEEKYTVAVTADSPGKVVIKGSICGVTIQAVTDKGIVSGLESASDSEALESAESLEGCIEDATGSGLGSASDTDGDTFAPGSLMKVDRNLTILFVPKGAGGVDSGGMGGPGGLYGDSDRDASARSAKPSPQTSGTKLEN